MGCSGADGRERVLRSWSSVGGSVTVSQAALSGPYAGFVISTIDNPWATSAAVSVFDLRTGSEVPGRGGERVGCASAYGATCRGAMDQLVLGSDAVSAVHATLRDTNGCGCTVEEIQASDSTGPHTLDSITQPDGSPPALTNLALTGDTLTWQHNGTPRSAQL